MKLALMKPERIGILLVAHGTRSQRGLAEVRELAELVARLAPTLPVELGFLELAKPTIGQAIAALATQGVQRIAVSPMLLLAAGHAKRDVPEAVAEACHEYGLTATQSPHLGCHELLRRLSARRFTEAVGEGRGAARADTLLIMVGRGSRDADALAEMRKYAQLRSADTPVARVETCYLAMAEPGFEELAARAVEARFPRVVVQPHLLFEGELLDRLRREVHEIAARWPSQEWILTPHLGPARELAEALLDRMMAPTVASGWA